MLTQEKIQRYSSQIILPEIGAEGQKKICDAKVLIIGVGGLGSACSLYLAAAGVGFFGLLDNDELELSNLHRQILYKSNSVGKEKTTLAANRLKENNPNLHCELYTERFDFDNYKKEGKQKFEDYNLIIDCSDNMQTKISANQPCTPSQNSYYFWSCYTVERKYFCLQTFSGCLLRMPLFFK